MCVITRAESLSLSPKTRRRSGRLPARAVEFGGGDGVVFVDDGDDAELEQRGQRGAKILVPLRVEEIVFGQQHLRDAIAQLLEGVVVHAHQAALADRGAGLNRGHFRWAAKRARGAARPIPRRPRRPAGLRVPARRRLASDSAMP